MFAYFDSNHMWSSAVNIALMAGGDLGQIDRFLRPLKSQVSTPEGWLQAWTSLGNQQSTLAEQDILCQFSSSAASRFLRAGIYMLTGERQMPPGPAKLEAYRAGCAAFRRGAALLNPPLERVAIPSPDGMLPGYMVPARAPTKGAVPVIIFYNGFDSTSEVLYGIIRNTFADVGIACLIVDTPGTGEPLRLREVPTRHDYEVPTKAIVDFLETRPDVDATRIGLLGISLGGYYAPRGASYEPRIKAVAAWGGIWDYGQLWKTRWETRSIHTSVPFWQLPFVTGTDDVEGALRRLESFKLDEALPNLKQPFLILHGETDTIPVEHAEAALTAAGSEDKRLRLFTAEEGGCEHVGADDPDPSRLFVLDWFLQKL